MSIQLINTNVLSKTQWHEWRSKGIGGSDAACICGLNKYKSTIELWMEKTGKLEPKEAGEAAYWGTIIEPIVRQEFINRTNIPVKREPFILQHPEYKFMFANVDGIAIDPIHGECIFEAKTASAFKQDQWKNDIPEEYTLQVQHYMAVTGYKAAHVAVLIGGNQFKYKFIERDEELISLLIKLEKDFWNHVITDTPPALDGSDASSDLLNRLYPETKFKNQIELPSEAGSLIKQYEEASANEKQAALVKDEAINKLKQMLGDNEAGIINGMTVTWKSLSSEKFDSKKLQLEMPEVYSKNIYISNYRRFSIK